MKSTERSDSKSEKELLTHKSFSNVDFCVNKLEKCQHFALYSICTCTYCTYLTIPWMLLNLNVHLQLLILVTSGGLEGHMGKYTNGFYSFQGS